MKKILIIDDDVHIGDMLEEVLTKEGYGIVRAYSGTEARLLLRDCKPDLILLDLMLPGLSGEELLAEIRGVPVIIMSAKVDVDGKVALLLGGAVDYITKPFDTRELLARIKVALRRTKENLDGVLSFGGITLNSGAHEVSVDGIGVKLTRTEFAILRVLMTNPTQTVTKTALLERISHDTPDCTESSLKIHISNLRRKLRDTGGRDCIEAVWGIGFRLTEDV